MTHTVLVFAQNLVLESVTLRVNQAMISIHPQKHANVHQRRIIQFQIVTLTVRADAGLLVRAVVTVNVSLTMESRGVEHAQCVRLTVWEDVE